jgi:sugar lactone lactonase YvrE
MMKTLKTNVLANGFSRLEAPRWHIGALWVSDTGAGKVYRVEINGRATVVADVPSRPFGLGFLPRGALLVASMRKKQILNFSGSKPAIHADMTGLAVGDLRDLAVARDGNTFVTCFDSEGSAPDCFKTAQVLLTTPAGETRVVAEDLAHPNGLAITSTHELLVAETLGNRLLAFDIAGDGTLLHRKVFANFERMSPLGICVDSEGPSGRRPPGSPCLSVSCRGPRHSSRSRSRTPCGGVSIGRSGRSDAFLPDCRGQHG